MCPIQIQMIVPKGSGPYETCFLAIAGVMTKLRKYFYLARYGIGKLVFPVLEPMFILRENLRMTVRRHLDQAIKHIENKNFVVAQLNLNMVLSLYPNHFLARVYRGRIYLRQKQYRLASEDFLQANRISPFRFTHYRLYREYLESVGENSRYGEGHSPANWMGRLKEFPKAPDAKGYDGAEASESKSVFEDSMDFDEESFVVNQDLDLTDSDRDKFGDMGPITSQEAAEADWDHVLKKLIS